MPPIANNGRMCVATCITDRPILSMKVLNALITESFQDSHYFTAAFT